MKNATAYERKIKRLLGGIPKGRPFEPPADPIAVVMTSVFEAEVTRKEAGAAVEALMSEYVDYNELRVAPPKEIAEHVGRNHYAAREKAESLVRSLNSIFDRTCSMSVEYMTKMTKRDLRRHLMEVGLSPYAASAVVLKVFGGHAVPVDQSLVDCLEMEGYAHPGSDLADVQGFLERVIPQKDALVAHEFLRAYIEKFTKVLVKKRQARAAAAQRAQAAMKHSEAAAKKVDLAIQKELADEAGHPADEPEVQEAVEVEKVADAVAAGGPKPAGRPERPMGKRPARSASRRSGIKAAVARKRAAEK